MSLTSTYLVTLALAAVIVLLTTPAVRKVANAHGVVDKPGGRHINERVTPRLGGAAVASGMVVALVFGTWTLPEVPRATVQINTTLNYPLLFASGVCMFAVGLVDDVIGLRPLQKFMGQIAASALATAGGLIIGVIVNPFAAEYLSLGWIDYPLTVLYLVAYANIINLIDGIDGLASGITALSSATMFLLALDAGHLDAALLACVMAGAALGFLHYNSYPASIFLGDCGSLLMGYVLGVVSLLNVTRVAGITTLVVPLVIAGVPIIDTLAAIVRRSRAHVSIGQGDAGHVHHRLLREGFDQRQAVRILYGMTAVLCICSYVMTKVNTQARITLFLAVVVVTVLTAKRLHMFEPVLVRRFDPDSGKDELAPVESADDALYSDEEIRAMLTGETSPESASRPALDAAPVSKKLRVLAVGQHYWPEPFNFSDICEELAARGYEVTMLTGLPNYPEGELYDGYQHGQNRVQDRNGVHVVRSSLIPRRHGALLRVANYYSFAFRASRLAQKLKGDYDVILSFQTSPVMMSRPAIAYARKYNKPLLLYCMDIWPECLTAGGIRRDSAVFNHYKKVSRKIYDEADLLAITSPMFEDYLQDTLHIPAKDVVYLPQYAEDVFQTGAEHEVEGYESNRLNLTFAGNVGAAQSVSTLVEAARILKDDDRFLFHVVGSGSELENLKSLVAEYGLTNVIFHGRHPLEEMPAYYAASDAMVATFSNSPMLGYTLPRKIQSYMAAGKPVLGTLVGEARRAVSESGCGLCCDAEDAEGLAHICRTFAKYDERERERMSRRARAYYQEHYSREDFFRTLEGAIGQLEGTGHAACGH